MPKERYRNIAAAYLVLVKDSKVFLQRRCNTGYEDGNYGMPAGHVEEKESFTGCVIREIKEEIGIDLKSEDLKVVHVMHRYGGEKNERVDVFFTAEKYGGEITNMELHKCDELSWHDLDNLPENIIPYIKKAIENVKNKVFYSEFGWQK